jgi:hypothetical protein
MFRISEEKQHRTLQKFCLNNTHFLRFEVLMVATKHFHNVTLCLSGRTLRTFRGNMLHSSLKIFPDFLEK